ncbi:MAG: FkbM family methyltransferase [Bacteroidales bacterium]|nr:FkbM family methyltransferase [Bacteroidales bacterium]
MIFFKQIIYFYKSLHFVVATKLAFFYFIKKIANPWSKTSYSQTGEDLIIDALMNNKKNGFYVDVGCNHPVDISNTFYFYLKGWKGINIDVNERMIMLFKKIRRYDVSVCAAVSDEEKEMDLYKFDRNAVSTFDENTAEEWKKKWNLLKIEKYRTTTLNKILEMYMPSTNEKIDFLSIDVEGMDYNVLKSVDLNKYKPKLIIIETHNFNITKFADNEITKYLRKFDYDFITYASMNAYFLRKES